MLVKSQWAFLL